MNALLQQIFMTPTLRYGLMKVHPSTSIEPQDNILVQVPIPPSLSFLSLSRKKLFKLIQY